MYWLVWIVAGVLIGAVACVGARSWQTAALTLGAGLAGAMVGGLISVAQRPPRDAFLVHGPSLVASIIGGLLAVAIMRAVRRAPTRHES